MSRGDAARTQAFEDDLLRAAGSHFRGTEGGGAALTQTIPLMGMQRQKIYVHRHGGLEQWPRAGYKERAAFSQWLNDRWPLNPSQATMVAGLAVRQWSGKCA